MCVNFKSVNFRVVSRRVVVNQITEIDMRGSETLIAMITETEAEMAGIKTTGVHQVSHCFLLTYNSTIKSCVTKW